MQNCMQKNTRPTQPLDFCTHLKKKRNISGNMRAKGLILFVPGQVSLVHPKLSVSP